MDLTPLTDVSNQDVFSDMLQRLQALGERLNSKEAEADTLRLQCSSFQGQLNVSLSEASSVREELQQEALRAELLQQKCSRQEQELQTQAQLISSIKTEHTALDNTLALAQAQLSTVTSDLDDKTRELADLSAYYSAMLAAKETSIESLQQLMDNQQVAHQHAQDLWEDQLAALKEAALLGHGVVAGALPAASSFFGASRTKPPTVLVDGYKQQRLLPSSSPEVASASAAVMSDVARLRIQELEAECRELIVKMRQLESQVKERDWLLGRAETRINDLLQPHHHQILAEEGARKRDRDQLQRRKQPPAFQASVMDFPSDVLDEQQQLLRAPLAALQEALRSLQGANLDKQLLLQQLEQVQAALLEERSKRDQLRDQLGTKLALKTAVSAQAAADQSHLKGQIEDLRRRQAADADSATRALMESRTETAQYRLQVKDLKNKIEDIQATYQSMAGQAESQHKQQLLELKRDYLARISELEDLLAAKISNVLSKKPAVPAAHVSLAEHRALLARRLQGQREQAVKAAEEMRKELEKRHKEVEALMRKKYEIQVEEATAFARTLALGEQDANMRQLTSRITRLEEQLADSAENAQKAQNSLSVVRRSWERLRRSIANLHTLTASDLGSQRDGMRIQQDLLPLMLIEWDPTHTSSFDLAAEKALTAAAGVVEHFAERWQSQKRQFDALSSRVAEAEVSQQAVSLSEAQRIEEAERALQQVLESREAVRRDLTDTKAELLQVHAELVAARAEARRQAASSSSGDTAMKHRLRLLEEECSLLHKEVSFLRGAQGKEKVHGLVVGKQQGRMQDHSLQIGAAMIQKRDDDYIHGQSNEVQDLRATVGLLHERINFQQNEILSQVDGLKQKLYSIAPAVALPSLLDMSTLSNYPTAAAAADVLEKAAAASAASLEPFKTFKELLVTTTTKDPLNLPMPGNASTDQQPASGGHCYQRSSPLRQQGPAASGATQPQAKTAEEALVQAVLAAQAEVLSMSGRLGQLEVAHWELSRGLSAMQAARGYLLSLCKEMQAGRTSIALVLAQEMLALLDTPTSHTAITAATSQHHSVAPLLDYLSSSPSRAPHILALPPPGLHLSATSPGRPQLQTTSTDAAKLTADLETARQVGSALAVSAKTIEAMLAGLVQAIPQWLHVRQAQAKAQHRQDLSRMRSMAESRFGQLRSELKQLRGLALSELQQASLQLGALGAVVTGDLGGALEILQTASARNEGTSAPRVSGGTSQQGTGFMGSAELAVNVAAQDEAHVVGQGRNQALMEGVLKKVAAERNDVASGLRALLAHVGGTGGTGGVAEAAAASAATGSLAGPVLQLQSSITSIRTEVDALKKEKTMLEHELAKAVMETVQLQYMLDSSHGHLREVLLAVDAHTQLPEGLPEALMALTLEEEQTVVVDPGGRQQSRSVNPQAEVWASALIGFKEHVASYLQHIEESAAEAAASHLLSHAVKPLEAQCKSLSAELHTTKSSLLDLQVQVHDTVVANSQALKVCRQETESAAEEALEGVLALIRAEVQGAGDQARQLRAWMSQSWSSAGAAWQSRMDSRQGEAHAAVDALEGALDKMRERLEDHVEQLEHAKEDLVVAQQEAQSATTTSASQLQQKTAEVSMLRERLLAMEEREGGLEDETMRLRRALKAIGTSVPELKAVPAIESVALTTE